MGEGPTAATVTSPPLSRLALFTQHRHKVSYSPLPFTSWYLASLGMMSRLSAAPQRANFTVRRHWRKKKAFCHGKKNSES